MIVLQSPGPKIMFGPVFQLAAEMQPMQATAPQNERPQYNAAGAAHSYSIQNTKQCRKSLFLTTFQS